MAKEPYFLTKYFEFLGVILFIVMNTRVLIINSCGFDKKWTDLSLKY
jgi:hypothetical protein